MLRTLVSPWTGCTRAERKNSAWGPFFLTTLVGSGGVCQAVSGVEDAGLSERLLAAMEAAFSCPKPSALPFDFRLGQFLMQRLAIPSDYVLQFILGRASYVLPWEDRLCPGNPTDDPETGAEEYNAYAIKKAQGVDRATKPDPVLDAVYLALKTPGEAYRALAGDLAEAYQGRYRFLIDNLAQWDEETRWLRADLVFSNAELRHLSATQVMALRTRAAEV